MKSKDVLRSALIMTMALGATTTAPADATPGSISPSAGATVTTFDIPGLTHTFGVAVDDDGTLYIADHHAIKKVTFDQNGDATTTTLNIPDLRATNGIAVDDDGTLYVAGDTNSNSSDGIQKITFDQNGDATVTTLNTPGLTGTEGVALDNDGNFYTASLFDDLLKITFDQNGDATVALVAIPGTPPTDGVALDDDGSIYIANDVGIQKVTFDQNGDATITTLSIPGLGYAEGVAVDNDGNLYIADYFAIHKVTFDTAKPSVTAEATAARAGESTTIKFTCSDGGSDMNSCTATLDGQPVENGDPFDTSKRGTQTLVVTAVDNAGNKTTTETTITIQGKRELTADYANATAQRGSIARLYMATFTRDPEGQGFAFWEASHTNGLTLQAMAEYFATSPEFTSLYGNTTNTEFVDLMYLNVMDRTADTEGHTFWLGQLDGGMTQPRMLLMLSESPEFKGLTYTS